MAMTKTAQGAVLHAIFNGGEPGTALVRRTKETPNNGGIGVGLAAEA